MRLLYCLRFLSFHSPSKYSLLLRPTFLFSHTPTLSLSSSPPFHLILSSSSSQTFTLQSILRHHALIITSGNSTNRFFAAKLISLYSSSHRPDLSTRVFLDSVPSNPLDTFLWNSAIKTHFAHSNFPLAIQFYRRMLFSGALPNQFSIPMVVSACAELLELGIGSCVHGNSIKFGLFNGDSVGAGSSLVYFYSKCGVVDDAFRVFDEMSVKDVVSWTALIAGCVKNGEPELGLVCLSGMVRLGDDGGARPNSRTLEAGLQACGSLGTLEAGRCLHGLSVKSGIGHFLCVQSSLLSMYSKCESSEDSFLLLHELPEKDLVSWTAIIGVYCRKGLILEALELFLLMQDAGLEPDGVLISCILMGVVNSANIYGGKAFHGFILRRNLELGVSVSNALISMYSKLGLLGIAEKIFNVMDERDSESWNLMVSGYGRVGLDVKCLDSYKKMQLLNSDLICDINSLVSVISSCSRLGELCLGQSVHCFSIKNMIDGEISIANAHIGMYGRCGKLELAKTIFEHATKDIVTWNALIAAYAHSGHSNYALSLLEEMLAEDVKPNSATLVSVLSACSDLAALDRGKWIDNYIKEMGLDSDISLSTSLVDMYAKCGQLETSRAVFDSMADKDVISWNVMISGYGIHGYAKGALDLFTEMEKGGPAPNGVTFLAVLSACSHAGFVDEGKRLFGRMDMYSIRPTLKHYACMVDLLGKSGYLSDAESMVLTMPIEPDGGIWGALLGACKMHNNVEMGERVARKAFELDPENDGYHVLMSNMFGDAGRWDDVEMLRATMKNNGLKKRAGWSSVEISGKIHLFIAGDRSHEQSEDIYKMLEVSTRQMEVSMLCGTG
ncbi:pentatricopeptide repeat-containing protein At4g39952, mitochondrial [Typha angustifolia]|uniref:pentatricopeptide repeat-containing protein At4g39952, mitochondrial n=1 Tax=Typha angustifolia TaxID=59011 RepID=UPI003C2E1C47